VQHANKSHEVRLLFLQNNSHSNKEHVNLYHATVNSYTHIKIRDFNNNKMVFKLLLNK